MTFGNRFHVIETVKEHEDFERAQGHFTAMNRTTPSTTKIGITR